MQQVSPTDKPNMLIKENTLLLLRFRHAVIMKFLIIIS
jgi:hypothetical protein